MELIRSPRARAGPGREVYVALGRGELRQGRTLDSLQSAYRVGARVAWRRVAEAARRAGFDAEALSLLAESIFAFIEELSADSVEGYAEARTRQEGERRRRQRELLLLLLRDPPAEEADLRAAAAAVRLARPARGRRDRLRRGGARADRARGCPPTRWSAALDGEGCAVVPDPEGPGRAAEHRAARWPAGRAALGPAVALGRAGRHPGRSRAPRWARAEAGAIGRGPAARRRRPRRPAAVRGPRASSSASPRAGWPPSTSSPRRRARRMEETALAYVREGGNAAAMARSLDLHPQTVRYRLGALRELLGEQLDDPDARLELELALQRSGALGALELPPA